jgi:hypothetical protein
VASNRDGLSVNNSDLDNSATLAFDANRLNDIGGTGGVVSAIPIAVVTETPVVSFCQKHSIVAHVETAKSAVDECFPARKALHMGLDEDPEEDGQWVVIEVVVDQGADEFLEAYNRCISLWAERIPSEALALIRLSYDFCNESA